MKNIFLEACRKMHPKESIKVFVECIAETLKYAPHRGTRVSFYNNMDVYHMVADDLLAYWQGLMHICDLNCFQALNNLP